MADRHHDRGVGNGDPEGAGQGAGIVRLAFLGTGVLVATGVAGALAPGPLGAIHAGVSVVLFVVGTAALLWAYALGVTRSRTDAVSLAGLFFLSADAAPADVRRPLRTALAIEVVASVAAAAARPYTVVAFGVLAPMFALGLMGMWSGRHGTFPPRPARDAA